METEPTSETPPVTSLDRALVVLETVATAGPEGLALSEIAAKTGINKGSVHRLLRGLAHRDYVARDGDDRNYILGEALRRMVRTFGADDNLPLLFRPLLLELSRRTEELVHLGVLDGRRVVYLDKIEPERSVRVWSRVGRRAHIASTALGRALIAAAPPSDSLLTSYVEEADPDHAHPTLGEKFRAAVDSARTHGWAIENQENETGIACVGIALTSTTSRDVAISVTGPAERMTTDRLAEIGALLRELAADLAPEEYTLTPTAG
ncbi:IclR family transcriptional regulator [Saccharopolyspora erythraea]|uniref:IclR family transcriptional regulator n=1 Tax=Saccharopolyspora erythraea TaxID=1836 RepID=UPI001BAB5CC9|nr:IclR family transcriptional regulator [Saccharopolyspora erythraea]QUH01953.1 IclR family transcriptional regulator [Saccharopolyspora erythraea]